MRVRHLIALTRKLISEAFACALQTFFDSLDRRTGDDCNLITSPTLASEAQKNLVVNGQSIEGRKNGYFLPIENNL